MKRLFIFTSKIVLILVIFSGCVSQKKYDELMEEKLRMESDLAVTEDELLEARNELTRLGKKLEELEKASQDLTLSLEEKNAQYDQLDREQKQLKTLYDNVLSNSGKLNRELAQQQEQLLAMRESNERLRVDLEEREKRVKEMEAILANQEKAVNDLRNRISQSLLSFKDSDLTVEIKNGKVYVSLAEQLLFKSGSVEVDPKGVTALKQLAEAIKDQKDLEILVEGHTDNVPISRTSQYMKDNWDLSVMRATSIVRILTGAGVPKDQITASGKGEFTPVMANESAEGRQKNRRTEIIIAPNLDELFRILDSN